MIQTIERNESGDTMSNLQPFEYMGVHMDIRFNDMPP